MRNERRECTHYSNPVPTAIVRQAKVLISIVNWNGGGTVRACIEQLLRSDFRSFSVIIIDNASSDDSLDGIEQKNPAIEVIRNDENRGFAGGHNQGLRIAAERDFEYYWMINSDLAVDPDTLQELVAAIESDARIAMVSPVIEDASVEGKIQFAADPSIGSKCPFETGICRTRSGGAAGQSRYVLPVGDCSTPATIRDGENRRSGRAILRLL